jgi:hypothetical protein
LKVQKNGVILIDEWVPVEWKAVEVAKAEAVRNLRKAFPRCQR